VTSTADLLDERPDAGVCLLALGQYGGLPSFEGDVATVRCHEDNVLVKARVGEPGEGRVLVVDGGGSRRVALLGDMIAGLAAANGWAGIVVNGCVRDVAVLRHLPIGITALGSCPRPSGKTGMGEVDVPVEFGSVTFRPGSRLVADEDGIVVIEASA
jgi:regulator of ribonuclease activity A